MSATEMMEDSDCYGEDFLDYSESLMSNDDSYNRYEEEQTITMADVEAELEEYREREYIAGGFPMCDTIATPVVPFAILPIPVPTPSLTDKLLTQKRSENKRLSNEMLELQKLNDEMRHSLNECRSNSKLSNAKLEEEIAELKDGNNALTYVVVMTSSIALVLIGILVS